MLQINKLQIETKYWGVAKLVKAPDFDSGMRRFESFFPSQTKKRVDDMVYTLLFFNA